MHYDSRAEIRNLGTGFYRFSQNEEERKKQMDRIRSIRATAMSAREAIISAKGARKAAFESRLQKIESRYAAKKQPRCKDDTGQISPEAPNDSNVSSEVENFLKNAWLGAKSQGQG